MRQRLLLAVFLAAFLPGQTQITLDSTQLEVSTVITGLDIPWEVQWGPDNWLWLTERYGRISRVNPDNGTQDVLLDHSTTVYQAKESGMLGLVLHPNFTQQPYVYVVYTYEAGLALWERLSRWEYNGTTLINETILLDSIIANETHDGSRLMLLPDTTLLMTTGDAQTAASAQDINNLSGKVLRLNLDGTIPADNPISGSYLWSWGHRNPQGLVQGPLGLVYLTEHGPQTDDELNLLLSGRNYGWPNVQGYCDSPTEMQFCADSNVAEPLFSWTPTIAISDLVWFDHPSIPEWENSLLITALKDKRLYQVRLSPDGLQYVEQKEYFNGTWGRLRDITVSPDGRVFLATSGASWTNTMPFTHSIIELSSMPTGVDDVYSELPQLKAFPNPATENVSISWQGGTKSVRASLRDLTGRELGSWVLTNNFGRIELNDLPAGVLILEISSGESTQIFRVVHQAR